MMMIQIQFLAVKFLNPLKLLFLYFFNYLYRRMGFLYC